jgi:hypothetical protein
LEVSAASMGGMDISEIRWKNFRLLAGHHGGITEAAAKLGKTQGQVSHFGGETPIKNIGAKVAREIEVAFAKPHGWLDRPQWPGSLAVEGSQSMGLDPGKLETSIQFVQKQFDSWHKDFIAGDRVALITAVYDELQRTSTPNWIELSRWLADQVMGEDDERQRTTGSTGGHDLGRNQRGAGAAKTATGKP